MAKELFDYDDSVPAWFGIALLVVLAMVVTVIATLLRVLLP